MNEHDLATEPRQTEATSKGAVEIVLVEDDPNDAELIVRALRRSSLGNKIVVLRDGAEALDYFFGPNGSVQTHPAEKPKLILLDLKLPKVNGIEVLGKIKQNELTKEIPVVILTSSQEEMDLEAAYAAGANSYVAKPIVFAEFAKVVTDLELYWLLINKAPST